jgi:hypothetical protein
MEDTVLRAHCTLCAKSFHNNDNAIAQHLSSKAHTKKTRKFNRAYAGFMKLARHHVLNSSRPKNKFYRRLLYYKMLANFEFDVNN